VRIDIGSDAVADIVIDCSGQLMTARITRQSAAMLGLEPGKQVFAVIKSVTFDRASTIRAVTGGTTS